MSLKICMCVPYLNKYLYICGPTSGDKNDFIQVESKRPTVWVTFCAVTCLCGCTHLHTPMPPGTVNRYHSLQ